MDYHDFITVSLNLRPNQIKSLNTVLSDGVLHIHIQLHPEENECPFCGGPIKVHSYSPRTLYHSEAFGTLSMIHWNRTRFSCKDCKKTFSEKNIFGPENYRHTYTVLNKIALDLKNSNYSFEDIAKMNHVSTSLVQLYADSFLRFPRIRLPENLGIDEVHSDMAKYGGAYLCVMVDNQHRCLTEILPDRSKKTLSKWFETIPLAERSKVKYVTIDMWQAYKDCALKYLPNCTIAVDNFHVVKNLNDAFDKLRIRIMNACVYGSPEYYLLKHWHKLLLSDKYNLDVDQEGKYNSFFRMKLNYRDIYNMLLDISPTLTLAYRLKEKYRIFNRDATEENCVQQFNQLILEFTAANLPCYEEFINMLKHWRTEILNSCICQSKMDQLFNRKRINLKAVDMMNYHHQSTAIFHSFSKILFTSLYPFPI